VVLLGGFLPPPPTPRGPVLGLAKALDPTYWLLLERSLSAAAAAMITAPTATRCQ
jgi:hypothetical protein